MKNVKPEEEPKSFASKVENKESLFIMCFSILSTKYLLKNLYNDENPIQIKKEEKEKCLNKEMFQIEENNNKCEEKYENKIDLL